MPSVPPVGPMEQLPSYETVVARDIAAMDMDTYKRYRPATPTGSQSQPTSGSVAPRESQHASRQSLGGELPVISGITGTTRLATGGPLSQYDVPPVGYNAVAGMDNTAVGYGTGGDHRVHDDGPGDPDDLVEGDPLPEHAGAPLRAVRREEDGTGNDAGPDRQLHALQQPADPRRAAGRGRPHEDARHLGEPVRNHGCGAGLCCRGVGTPPQCLL